MSKVPPEIDRLLWATAESGDPRAVEEFGERYPAYRTELVERVKMVRSFRAARPHAEAPVFRPSMELTRRRSPRGWVFAAGALAFASFAFASVATWRHFNNAAPQPAQTTNSWSNPAKDSSQPEVARPGDTMHVIPKTGSGPVVAKDPEAPVTPFERVVSASHEHIGLVQLLRELGAQAKVRIDIAPGFENQIVEARYLGLPLMQVLEDLGQNFGFTATVQDETSVLVIPAIDPSRPPVTVPDGSFSAPTGDENPAHKPAPALKSGNIDKGVANY